MPLALTFHASPADRVVELLSGGQRALRTGCFQFQPPPWLRRPWHVQTTGISPSGPGSRIQRCPQQSGHAASYAAFGVGVVQAPVAVPPGRQPMGIQNIDHLHQPPPRRRGWGRFLCSWIFAQYAYSPSWRGPPWGGSLCALARRGAPKLLQWSESFLQGPQTQNLHVGCPSHQHLETGVLQAVPLRARQDSNLRPSA